MKGRPMITLLVSVLLTISMAVAVYAEPTDYVFANGKVYTVNEKQPWAEVVVVKGNKIVYVGDNAGTTAFIGEGTEQVDLKGRMMLPGFVESHIHIVMGGATPPGSFSR